MDHFFAQHIIFVPLASYVVATVLKGIILWRQNRFQIHVVLSTGGMPSGHSALVASLATAIGIKMGPFSDMFALALIFAAVVIYDAMNIRYQSGLHAQTLNTLKGEKRLNESLGHLPSETLAGSVIGIIVAIILMQI